MNFPRYVVVLTALGFSLCSGCALVTRPKGGLVSVGPAGVTDSPARPKRFALLIGINRFEDSRFSNLRYAVRDAFALAEAIENFDEVQILATPEQTTRSALLKSLAALGRKAVNPKDTVLIYFSTHGSLGQVPGKLLARYLVSSDTRLEAMAETGIPVDSLIQSLDSFGARRRVLILATCHSGKGKSTFSDSLAESLARGKSSLSLTPLSEVSEASIILTASAFGETARESDEFQQDIYTHFFIEGMQQGDKDGDGAVVVSEAHDYARERTYVYTHGGQRPSAESEVLGKDPIVLKGSQRFSARPVIYSYAPSAEGVEVWLDGAAKGTLPGGIDLEPGNHRLKLINTKNGASLYQGSIALHSGERMDLSEMVSTHARLEVALLAVGQSPLSSSSVARYFPVTYGGQLRVDVRDWPRGPFSSSIAFAYLSGEGRESPSLPFRMQMQQLEIGLGRPIRLSQKWMLVPSSSLGGFVAERLFQTNTYRQQQWALGAAATAGARLEWTLTSPLKAGAQVEVEALFTRLGKSVEPLMTGRVGVFVAYNFLD